MPEGRSALRLALDPAVVRRAMLFAVIVGPILISINHGDALLRGQLDAGRWLKMGLTVLVPYLVSTVSSVAALRGAGD
jgi:hypothetical protein